MEKISVIVPVYNVEEFISCCLDSICNQSYSNTQIIVIDDGSTDGSLEICRKYSENDNRISIISQKNSGVSVARNKGICMADGKYICFVDADDILEITAFEKMIKKAKNVDLVVSRYTVINQNGHEIKKARCYDDFIINSNKMIDSLLSIDSNLGYQGYLWNKLFLTDIVKKNNLKFSEVISYNEDRLFILQYLLNTQNIKFISDTTYMYRMRNGSAMDNVHKSFSLNQLSELSAFKIIENELIRFNESLYNKSRFASFYCAVNLYRRVPNISKYKNEKKRLRNSINERLFEAVFEKKTNISIKNRFKCFCYWILINMRIIK